ncbi:hypothetical protein OKA04_04535 [Luteolibacter flavescens]|uniref:Uncharacterized protein n=1 Tax=Luteolibacter flavescens TaxID=1859460 RepID=A0ABT3FK83_9BACT|nr:hypothetical protein [Luteolibacter flavescens]MCW1883983.1 hypothetical protein [Luteolibacter flavescens]
MKLRTDHQSSAGDRSPRTLREIQKAAARKPRKPRVPTRSFNPHTLSPTGGLTDRERAEAMQQLRKFRPDHLL